MPADRLRIFVSHSSRDNLLTEQVCALLGEERPGQVAFDVLVDTRTLEGSAPWPQQLHEMMAHCHAAVVLLSKNAVASDWVLKETTILTWRRSLEPELKLFIAQFPDVTAAELSEGRFDPLHHRQLQGIDSADPAVIARAVRTGIEADAVRPAETLFDRIRVRVANVLQKLDPNMLAAVGAKLGAKQVAWRPGGAAQATAADAIASCILRGELGDYPGLVDLMNELRTLISKEQLQDLLQLAAPHWVERRAAGPLAALAMDAAPGQRARAAAINGRKVRAYTSRMYLHSAFPLLHQYRLCAPRAAVAGDVLEHYTKRICEFCSKLTRFADASDDAEIVAALNEGKPWLFVVIAPPDAAALDELQDRFEQVRFVIDLGETPDRELPARVLRLRPPVRLDLEGLHHDDYMNALNVCDA